MTQRTRSIIVGSIMLTFFLTILALVVAFGPGEPSGCCGSHSHQPVARP